MFHILIFIFLYLITYCESANILYVIPFTSKSHYIMLKPIGLELARRGHNVTVITGYREANPPPNYHQVMVDLKYIWDVLGEERPNVFSMVNLPDEEFHNKILWGGGLGFTEVALNSSAVQEFLKQDNTFNLVINEQFYQEAMYILSYKYSAPFILVTTFGSCMRHNILTNHPLQLSVLMSEFLNVQQPKSFAGRLRNFYFTFYEYFWWRYWYMEKQEELVRKYVPGLPESRPSLMEIQKNVSLMLINSHFSFNPPAAFLSNVVEIGGLHLTHEYEKLPKDLQIILDNATKGVIYMAFGSNVQSQELPDDKLDAFLNVFRRLENYTVLWKWEGDRLENMSYNVVVRKWLPQKEILAHQNTKLFISHGGLIGTHEAVFSGTPIIGIPIYADQYNNLLHVQEKGMGKILKFKDISEKRLENLLTEVLLNESYLDSAKEISKRFQDRPMSALKTSIFWIEYVLRHQGARFMKNPALEMNWVESNMLDVFCFLLLAVVIFIYLFITFTKWIYTRNIFADDSLKK